jgi:predicted kinase
MNKKKKLVTLKIIKMNKIIVLIGCSNSGKSTWAHKQWEKNPQSTVIINRDKIRELLFSYTEDNVSEYYSRPDLSKLEKQVTKYEDTLINEALCEGKTVIVDATHLDVKYITRYEYWNKEIELVWFDVTLKEALTRNMSRRRQVDEAIITKQYVKYVNLRKELTSYSFSPKIIKNNRNLPPCVIYDVDGTIAKMTDRSPYDWSRVGEDLMIDSVCATIDWIGDLKLEYRPKVIICTGRDGEALEDTERWLIQNNIYYDEIFIRAKGDMRADWIVKQEMWESISKDNYIIGMYDDRLQVCRRARNLGLKVFNVEYNNF